MKRKTKGLSLIELLIVMIVVGTLSVIAFPAYRQYAMRAQRTDAKAALLRLAAAQEKFFLQNDTYTTNLGAPPAGLGIAQSDHGYYNIGVVPGPAGIGTSFVATAAPAPGSGQFADAACRTFQINETGLRTAQNAGGIDSTAECW